MIAILNINQMRKDANVKNKSKIRLLKNANFQMLENSPSRMMRSQLPRASKPLSRQHQLRASQQKLRAAPLINNYYSLKSKRLKLCHPLPMMI